MCVHMLGVFFQDWMPSCVFGGSEYAQSLSSTSVPWCCKWNFCCHHHRPYPSNPLTLLPTSGQPTFTHTPSLHTTSNRPVARSSLVFLVSKLKLCFKFLADQTPPFYSAGYGTVKNSLKNKGFLVCCSPPPSRQISIPFSDLITQDNSSSFPTATNCAL